MAKIISDKYRLQFYANHTRVASRMLHTYDDKFMLVFFFYNTAKKFKSIIYRHKKNETLRYICFFLCVLQHIDLMAVLKMFAQRCGRNTNNNQQQMVPIGHVSVSSLI